MPLMPQIGKVNGTLEDALSSIRQFDEMQLIM